MIFHLGVKVLRSIDFVISRILLYMNMSNAILKYKLTAMSKVSGTILFSTFIGNL